MEGFHSHDGWFWKRLPDGSVRVRFHGNPPASEPALEHIVDASSWASIVASVCLEGENSVSFREAERLHGAVGR